MNKIIIIISLVLAMVFAFAAGSWFGKQGRSDRGNREVLYYVDPMNPGFRSDQPGIAPCGMALEPVYADGGQRPQGSASPVDAGAVRMTTERQQEIGVRVSPVEKKAVTHTLRLVGRVAPDENLTYRVTASSEMWIRKVYPPTTGSVVKKDEPLFAFYTTNFLTAAQSYQFALDTLDRAEKTHVEGSAQMAVINVQIRQAIEALQNLGVSDTQIAHMEQTRKVDSYVDVRSPAKGFIITRNATLNQWIAPGTELYVIADLSRVWILAEIFENEGQFVRPGMRVKVTHPQMNRTFDAKVSDILPQFDPQTRTMKVRLDAANPGYVLRPDMFVDVEIPLQLPPAITVPADALIDSGLKKVVYVVKGDGYFEPRRVETGWRFGRNVEITGGLMPGEKIVVSGTFLIDSESRMRVAAQGIRSEGVQDPVCRMFVDEMKADTLGMKSDYNGRTYFFCSEKCRNEFGKDPKKYADKKAPDTAESDRHDMHGSKESGMSKSMEHSGHKSDHSNHGKEMKGNDQDMSPKAMPVTPSQDLKKSWMEMEGDGQHPVPFPQQAPVKE